MVCCKFLILVCIVNKDVSDDDLQEVLEAVGAMSLTEQQLFSLATGQDALQRLRELKARRQDVIKIEKNIYVKNTQVAFLIPYFSD